MIPAQTIRNRAATLSRRILALDRTPAGLARVAGTVMTMAENAARTAAKQHPPPQPIACHSGCSWCCYQHFGATVPEVAMLADHVLSGWSTLELPRLLARFRDVFRARAGKGLSGWQDAQTPCALLGRESGSCLAYSARAIICRAHTSFSEDGCRRLFRGEQASTVGYGPRAQVFAAAGAGILDGLGRVGLGDEIVELNVALAMALTDDQALNRWCAGEDVFKEAKV